MFVWMLFLCHLQKRKLNASVMTGGAGERFGRWQRPPMEPETEETSHPPLPQVQQREVSGSRIKAAAGQKHRILNWVHLLSSFSLSCFSACSVRPHTWSGATWTVIFWVGLVSVCRLFQLLVFAVIQCANRWYFIWHICLCACKTVHRALEVTESLILSISLSAGLQLNTWYLGHLLCLWGFSHHWGTGVKPTQTPEGLYQFTPRRDTNMSWIKTEVMWAIFFLSSSWSGMVM